MEVPTWVVDRYSVRLVTILIARVIFTDGLLRFACNSSRAVTRV